MFPRSGAAALGLAVAVAARISAADEGSCQQVSRATVARCALERAPELRLTRATEAAARGRQRAATSFLPSNPTLTGSLAPRTSPGDRDLNWYLTLSAELEIAGQSAARTSAAELELDAARLRSQLARTEAAQRAWEAYFNALAAKERVTLSKRLETLTTEVAASVRGMAANGLVPELDADVAEGGAFQATQQRLEREAAASVARTELELLTGGVITDGALQPLPASPPGSRVELQVLRRATEAADRRVELARRERVPNPSVSIYAQNDGFRERVLGVGLSVPIPLPEPLGRTGGGQLEEALGIASETRAELDRVDRLVALELASARASWDAAVASRALFTTERINRASDRLTALAAQIKAGRVGAREAVAAQQALVGQLEADIETRRALCLASVRLRRATGASLEEEIAP